MAWSRSAVVRSGSGISAIFASTSRSASASLAAAFCSRARSRMAARSSAVNALDALAFPAGFLSAMSRMLPRNRPRQSRVVPYDPTIYRGSAEHYRPGRPPYSPRLEEVLTEELGLDGTGRLLDVGCGPGILTLRLARLFDGAIGLDPDPDML